MVYLVALLGVGSLLRVAFDLARWLHGKFAIGLAHGGWSLLGA